MKNFHTARSNKNDPRVFLYKNPKHKWMGVTLNFAHDKAWLIFITTMSPAAAIPLAGLAIAKWASPKTNSTLFFTLFGAVMVFAMIYTICILVYFYRKAAEDAKNHPEFTNS